MAGQQNSPSYKGAMYYGGGYYAGWDSNYLSPEYPLTGTGYKIIFYDRGGSKIGEITDEIQKPVLLNGSFDLLTTGCGMFRLELSELPSALSVLDYNYRVDIHLFNDSSPWYSGYIIKIPQDGTTVRTYTLSGYGYFNQLNDIVIKEDYALEYVDDIVKNLMTTYVEDKTDIIYRESKIKPALYEIQSVSWERIEAKEIFKQLSEYMNGYEFGVDATREFFFRPKSVTVEDEAQLFVGKNLDKFIPTADISSIKNKLYIYGGEVSGTPPTNYLVTVEDVSSQSAYGLKEAKMSIPSSLDVDDAEQWGDYKLAELKDPIQRATVSGIDIFQSKIEAKGKARVTSVNGLYEYTLPIVKVNYKFSKNGIQAKVQLGELETDFTRLQIDLKQRMYVQEQLSDQIITNL